MAELPLKACAIDALNWRSYFEDHSKGSYKPAQKQVIQLGRGTKRLTLVVQEAALTSFDKEEIMASVYKIIELVGTSEVSWEEAAKNAVETASKSLRDLRVAEISEMDMKLENGKVTAYRARVKISFKYEGGA
jgi:dodecin